MPRCMAAALLMLVLVIAKNATSSCVLGSPLSSGQLRFFDDLRTASPEVVDSKTQRGSSVVRVVQRWTNRTTKDEQTASGKIDETFAYRLCHLTAMLPLSNGKGQPNGPFGIFPARAALLAMSHFNHKIDTIVSDLATNDRLRNCNIRFTMDLQDTQRSPINANRILLNGVLSRNHSLLTPRPIAIVGASRSAVSGTLSITASTNHMPVISASSLSSILDNKGIFPLFGRTNAGTAGDAFAAVSYLRNVLNVTHMGLLYVRDTYGSAFQSDFTRAAFALDPPMKIVSASYDEAEGHDRTRSIKAAIARLAASELNYFFGIFLPHNLHEILREARNRDLIGKDKFWLLSNELAQIEDFRTTDRGLAHAIHGLTYISFNVHNTHFEEELQSIEHNEALRQYVMSKQPHDLNVSNLTIPSKASDWDYLAYDAVIALGMAACESTDVFFDGTSLFRAFKRTSFVGASGRVAFDKFSGSRNATNMPYRVNNVIANTPKEKGGVISFTVREIARLVTVSDDTNNSNTMTWITTNPTVYADGNNAAPQVLPPVVQNMNMVRVGVITFGLTLAGVVMAMAIAWGIWTVLYRHTRVVCSSQPKFLIMLCVGTFIMASSIIPRSLQEPLSNFGLDIACMATPWLFSLGWVVTISALFSKTLRVYELMKKSQSFCRVKIKPRDVLVPFLVLFTCNVTVLFAWTIVAPLKWTRVEVISHVGMFGRSSKSYAICASVGGKAGWPFPFLLSIIDIGCLLYASYVSYLARNIAAEYNETHYIGVSVLSMLETFIVGGPVLAVTYRNPEASFMVQSMLTAALCGAVLMPMFAPKEKMRRKYKMEEKLRSLIRAERKEYMILSRRNRFLRDERMRIS